MKNASLLPLLLLIFCSNLTAQNLTISQGEKEKTFKKNSLFEIELEHPEFKQDSCCDLIYLLGNIINTGKDSITMTLSEYKSQLTKNGERVRVERYIDAADMTYKFAPIDMAKFRSYKSLKAKKRKRNFRNWAGLTLCTGLVTGGVSFLVDKGENRNKILLASAIQMGASFTFIIAGNRKEYLFNSDKPVDNWKVRL